MWEHLADSDGGGLNMGPGDPGNIGGFASPDFYWSSTEYNQDDAWLQSFNNGAQVNFDKFFNYRVRPVRAF